MPVDREFCRLYRNIRVQSNGLFRAAEDRRARCRGQCCGDDRQIEKFFHLSLFLIRLYILYVELLLLDSNMSNYKQEDVELSPYVIKAYHKPAYYNGDTLRLNAQFTQIVGFHARVRFKW